MINALAILMLVLLSPTILAGLLTLLCVNRKLRLVVSRKLCAASGHSPGQFIEKYQHDFVGWQHSDQPVRSRVHGVEVQWLAVHHIKGKLRCVNCGAVYIGTVRVHRAPE